MLIVSRRAGERIHVGENVVITVCAARRGSVRLGISAPPEVQIIREEIAERPAAAPHGIGEDKTAGRRAVSASHGLNPNA